MASPNTILLRKNSPKPTVSVMTKYANKGPSRRDKWRRKVLLRKREVLLRKLGYKKEYLLSIFKLKYDS